MDEELAVQVAAWVLVVAAITGLGVLIFLLTQDDTPEPPSTTKLYQEEM